MNWMDWHFQSSNSSLTPSIWAISIDIELLSELTTSWPGDRPWQPSPSGSIGPGQPCVYHIDVSRPEPAIHVASGTVVAAGFAQTLRQAARPWTICESKHSHPFRCRASSAERRRAPKDPPLERQCGLQAPAATWSTPSCSGLCESMRCTHLQRIYWTSFAAQRNQWFCT